MRRVNLNRNHHACKNRRIKYSNKLQEKQGGVAGRGRVEPEGMLNGRFAQKANGPLANQSIQERGLHRHFIITKI